MDCQVVVPLFAAAPCVHCGVLSLPHPCQTFGHNFCAACGSNHCYYCWEWRRSDTRFDMMEPSNIDCHLEHLEADFEDSPRGLENHQTVGSEVAAVSDRTGDMDLYDKIELAWNEGGPVQLKFNTAAQVAEVSDLLPMSPGDCQRKLDASIAVFQRFADRLAWDTPKSIVAVPLDRRRTMVFQPGQKTISATLDSGLP